MSQNLSLNQYIMESGSMNILADFYLSVYHSLGPNYQCRIWAISTAKNLKLCIYMLLMKSPTFSQLGVQILHLGEIYQQEFGKGKRHLLYDPKRRVLGFQRGSVLTRSWFPVSHRSDRVVGWCGRLDYNSISGFSWQFRHPQLDATCRSHHILLAARK